MPQEFVVAIIVFAVLAIPAVPALLLNLRDDGWQFRFRTILLITTIAAGLLGLIGYLVRK